MVRTVQPGEQIGEMDCPACAAKVPVKVNRKGTISVICQNVIRHDAKTGKKERCFFRMTWGREKSRELIAEYLAGIEVERCEDEDVQYEDREGAENGAEDTGAGETSSGEGEGKGEPDKGGFGAKVHHFFTGD